MYISLDAWLRCGDGRQRPAGAYSTEGGFDTAAMIEIRIGS